MTRFLTVPLLLVALAVTACGGGGNVADSDRVESIVMRDIAFDPSALQVERGETVRFVFRNEGKVDHDAFIGHAAAQADHEADMREGKANGHHHGTAGNAVTVEPGDEGSLTYTFDDAGTVLIGCHEPGHYASGMRITVTVA